MILKSLPNRQSARRTKFIRGTLGIATAIIATTALAAGITTPASADPHRLPPEQSIVGVGSDTTEVLFDQLARIYDGQHPLGDGLYSYWATGSSTITPKAECQPITRPNGSSPGELALASRQVLPNGTPCIDFARSLSPRVPGAPSTWVWSPFALDAIDWATNARSNAPASLTAADIKAIIECTATQWDQVGGTSTATIQAYLPAQGPGILALLQRMAGVDYIGSCVGYEQQDQGTGPGIAGNPNALVFYSVGKYIAQAYEGIDDVHGDLVLGQVDDLSPVVFDRRSRRFEINVGQVPGVAAYPSVLLLPEWVVLAPDPDGTISPQLAHLFLGSGSWICADPAARRAIQDYGFLLLPQGQCGQPS